MASSSESSDEDSSHSDEYQQAEIKSTPWMKHAKGSSKAPVENTFKNDGSFLEMFKKMQDQKDVNNKTKEDNDCGSSSKSRTNSESDPKVDSKLESSDKLNKFVGKRRAARVLPTGLVKKQRKGEEPAVVQKPDGDAPQPGKGDPWTKYMDEVRKYKQQSCTDEDSNRRPLVK